MLIEIWSDVVCPFCYLGKKNLELALENLPEKDKIEIEWKSYQLNPDLGTTPMNTMEYLSETKGMHKDDVKEMFHRITTSGKEKGIVYNFDKSITVNTKSAHLLIQKAKEKGLADAAEEAFFKAHFTDGENVADRDFLEKIGLEIGLTSEEISDSQTNSKYEDAFRKDLYDATQIGVRGVPFFVINNKYGISGAQPPEVFENAINKALSEIRPSIIMEADGTSCDVDGNCD